jgi:hypothetical protein
MVCTALIIAKVWGGCKEGKTGKTGKIGKTGGAISFGLSEEFRR